MQAQTELQAAQEELVALKAAGVNSGKPSDSGKKASTGKKQRSGFSFNKMSKSMAQASSFMASKVASS